MNTLLDHRIIETILALNAAEEIATSSMNYESFLSRSNESFLTTWLPDDRQEDAFLPSAFLIAMDQDSAYDSPNFHWFQKHYSRFVYVDRIVTSESARGTGLATKLYLHLFDAARAAGHSVVTCEVNSDPPNPVSDQFHAHHGFIAVGSAKLQNGKAVAYLARRLA